MRSVKQFWINEQIEIFFNEFFQIYYRSAKSRHESPLVDVGSGPVPKAEITSWKSKRFFTIFNDQILPTGASLFLSAISLVEENGCKHPPYRFSLINKQSNSPRRRWCIMNLLNLILLQQSSIVLLPSKSLKNFTNYMKKYNNVFELVVCCTCICFIQYDTFLIPKRTIQNKIMKKITNGWEWGVHFTTFGNNTEH